MSFDAKDYPVSEILNKAVFNIPRNQRRYVWKKENWNDLYEDIVFSIEQKKPHFIGSIVLESLKKQDGLSYYTIIDGQQRIITVTLLLVAVMKVFYEEGMHDDYLGTVSYLQSKNNRNQDILIIDSEYHVSLSCLTQGIITLDNKSSSINAFVDTHVLAKKRDKLLGEAVKYFYSKIKTDLSQAVDKHERLRSIRSAILEMTAVRIVSSNEEDSYTIFEILNARGQELTPSELLKNYIMRYIQPIDRRDEAKAKWETMEQTLGTTMNKFIKHYATHRFGDTNNKYDSPYQAIQKATRGQNIGELLDDMELKSKYYSKIIEPKESEDGNCTPTEAKIYGFFKAKRFEQFRPILLSLIHQRELETLNEGRYELAIKYIYNFFICYTIIGQEKSNKLEDVVFKYAPLFENEFSDNLLQEFAEKLKQKIPSYEWFLNAFKNVGWSNHFDLYR
ncbi:MAG: DUF262 domain-containing protein, partial [Lachnospiraceae bacterium]|nr:DUF262 domain-containing protein [Lachnospiraceae bacterium]